MRFTTAIIPVALALLTGTALASPAPDPKAAAIAGMSAHVERSIFEKRDPELQKRCDCTSCDMDCVSTCETGCDAFNTGEFGGIAAGLCLLQCDPSCGCPNCC